MTSRAPEEIRTNGRDQAEREKDLELNIALFLLGKLIRTRVADTYFRVVVVVKLEICCIRREAKSSRLLNFWYISV